MKKSTRLAFVGDVHGNLRHFQRLTSKLQNIKAFIQVGDFELYHNIDAVKQDKYAFKHKHVAEEVIHRIMNDLLPTFPVPIFFIKGNHDDYDHLTSEKLKQANIHFLEQGTIHNISGVTIACLGGIYSPIRSNRKTKDLTGRDRRFFTKEEIQQLYTQNNKNIDIFISHQASTGILPNRKFQEEGIEILTQVLEALKPTFYIHGHHHKNYETRYKKTKVIGLGNFGKNPNSFKVLDFFPHSTEDNTN